MAKEKSQSYVKSGERRSAQKALLFEITGHERSKAGVGDQVWTQRIAALSLEEAVRHMRVSHPDFEISEIRVIGGIEVLSSSEHIA